MADVVSASFAIDSSELTSISTSEDLLSKRGISAWTATFNLVAGVVGIGILALAEQAKNAGLFACLFFCYVGAYCTLEGGLLCGDSMQDWNNIQTDEKELITSLESWGQAAFGKVGKGFVVLMNSVYYIGACATFIITVGNTFHDLIGRKYPVQVVRLFFVPLYLALPMLRDLSALAALSPLAITFSLSSAVAIVIQASMDVGRYQKWDSGDVDLFTVWPRDAMSALAVVPFMMAAYGIAGMIPTQASQMRKPEQLPIVLMSTVGIVIVVYTVVIVLGYVAYGNFICPDYIINMRSFPATLAEATEPFDQEKGWKLDSKQCGGSNWTAKNSSFWYYFVSVTVIPNLILSYPLLMMTVICAIQEFDHVRENWPVGSWKNYVMRLVCVCITIGIGCGLNDIGTALGLFAALTLPFSTVIFPIIFNWRIKRKLELPRRSTPRLAVHALLVVLALVAFGLGTFVSIRNIATG